MKKRFISVFAFLVFCLGSAQAQTAAITPPREPEHLTSLFNFANRTVKLNDGRTMPIIGFGAAGLSEGETETAVATALKNGYRLFDTAQVYGNDAAVGRAIRKSGVGRETIFLTARLAPENYADAAAAINGILRRLDTGYIDLLLLQQPAEGDVQAYLALEQMVKKGKVKSLGLSDYSKSQADKIVAAATVKPAVVQTEIHPFNQSQDLKNHLDQYGTVLEARYPLGGMGQGQHKVLNHPLIRKLAAKHNKTPAQIVLRWHLQIGNIILPGSNNPNQIKEYMNIFDFELNPEDMNEINAMEQGKRK